MAYGAYGGLDDGFRRPLGNGADFNVRALPYLAYIVAEQSVGASGVIAVVAAGLTLNLTGPGRLSPVAWTNLQEVWDLLAHWAGALIFILAALLIPRLLEGVQPSDFGLLAVVVLAATLARAAVLFGLLPLLTTIGLSPVVERPYRTRNALGWAAGRRDSGAGTSGH